MAEGQSALVRIRLAEGRIKRAFDLAQMVPSDSSKINLFRATARDLHCVRERFETDFVIVETTATTEDGFDAEAHTAHLADFEEKYFEVMSTLEAIEEVKVVSPGTPTTQVSKSRVALPKISLPKFDGSPQQWANFSNLFVTLVANNADISSVEKLAYLKTALNGEPLGMVQSLPISEANYEVAWKLLVGRYENKRLIVSVHVEALLKAPMAASDSPKALRNLLTIVNENLLALRALDVPVDQWDLILLPILCKRLDSVLQTQWELTQTDALPTVKNLLSFIETHCRAQETVTASRSHVPGAGPTQSRNQMPSWRQARQSVKSLVSSPQSCCVCNSTHVVFKCPKFIKSSPKDRYKIAKEHKLCLNCLSPSHASKDCSSSSCRYCGSRHHSLLHFEQQTAINPGPGKDASTTLIEPNPATVAVAAALPSEARTVLLSTAQVHVFDSSGTPMVVRALLDTASQASFVTESCLQRLRLTRRRSHLPVQGLANTSVNVAKSCASIVMAPVGSTSPQFAVDVFVISRITSNLPSAKLSARVRGAVAHLKLADPAFDTPGPVDLLIGAELVPRLLTGAKIDGSPVALDSVLGWILMGQVDTQVPSLTATSLCISLLTSHPPLDEVVKRFWELEEFPATTHKSPEDVKCEEWFSKTHLRSGDGRYSVSLPFRQPLLKLGASRPQALNRFLRLENRLKSDPKLKAMYSEFMSDYVASGHMEEVTESQIPSASYYIPHHCVVKPESSTTKLRVVFDASAKSSSGVSLNDALFTGTRLQRDIVDLLLSFRLHVVVFTGDIKQMYRQIGVHTHQDYQHIVWRFNDAEPVKDYRLKTVTYGVSAAPFLALRTLQQLAQDETEHFPTASQVLLTDVYVDDVVTGSNSVDSALAIQRELITLLGKGGFKLRKFMSNHQALLDWLPVEDIEIPQPFSLDSDDCVIKVLGLQWNPVSDTYSYKIQPSSGNATKRTILSNLARIFDPLGWLTPLSMFAKHLIQVLWARNLGWDTEPPDDILSNWKNFNTQLSQLSSVTIPRLIRGQAGGSYQLHGFSDSSEIGYAAVVYLRIDNPDGTVLVHLLIAKSKVAPLKVQSLPRLELCGALLLARLLHHVIDAYGATLHFSSVTAWTDSQVTLAWINSSPHELKTFVANRVSHIQELTRPEWWKHVRSEHNPADCGSRGLLPAQIVSHPLWWSGPSWLKKAEDQWPEGIPCIKASDVILLERKVVALGTFISPGDLDTLLERFSRLTRLLRVTACLFRFINNCRHPLEGRAIEELSSKDLNTALEFWIRYVQSMCYRSDLIALKKDQITSPQLRRLLPFIDSKGVIRVGGRLSHSDLPFEQKHPALLPKSNPLTRLIIGHYHEVNQHPGIQALQAILREKFWIMGDKRAITNLVHRCVRCFRASPSSVAPLMGNLPAMRVQQVKPFSRSGVDYAGPFLIKMARLRKAAVLKAYLCVFVCCATKAVHIELASDLSTDVFLAAYKRFIARRGRSSDIYSDCGTNFVGARNQLSELQQLLTSSSHQTTVASSLAHLGVTWHFNPPAAPHFGGLWEAGVKSFKSHLRRVIGEQILTYEELNTVLAQVEAVLNSRPLCPLSADPKDFTPLTPGHFLTLEPLVTIPEPDLRQVKMNCLHRWQLVSRLHQDFWHRWHRDYLHTLQQRSKWQKRASGLAPNQMVLVKEDRLPPLQWPLGRIVDLHHGTDGVARVATVRTVTGTVKRPAVKLCPLPCDC
ncbi:uncharacterized protein LOC134541050 [Bacillus rossius redtenbacheri]|uniref:uncharacterized protein LOC134541050 n=1 Tax=Bacillus rossius redtenbacheri TaxID=93214 RepID=UPI002FDCFA89